jgi:protein-tyrosine-phosphatase
MHILFVCRANVGRSQAAATFYNQLVPGHGASAGTIVDIEGQKIGERPGAANMITVMREHGLDISDNIRTQVTEELLKHYDRVIVMAEPETIPGWLKAHKKTEIWAIKDAKGVNIPGTRKIAAELKSRVEILAQEANRQH